MLVTWASASWLKDTLQGKSKQRMTKTGLPIHETLRFVLFHFNALYSHLPT